DVIGDFDALNVFEAIDLRSVSAITDLADLTSNHMTQTGANVVIDTGGGDSITLTGVNLGDLDSTDFIF
ncbi:MAG: calcium-binding protein, partial [Roseovarius sp.]|nr:calcium-binding protein [Roseovarius sp.]